jgi:hypothetical protein
MVACIDGCPIGVQPATFAGATNGDCAAHAVNANASTESNRFDRNASVIRAGAPVADRDHEAGAPAYNVRLAMRWTEHVDASALESALGEIVARHEARSFRQPVATSRNGFGLLRGFRADPICDRVPPVATTGLHKGPIGCCSNWRRGLPFAP